MEKYSTDSVSPIDFTFGGEHDIAALGDGHETLVVDLGDDLLDLILELRQWDIFLYSRWLIWSLCKYRLSDSIIWFVLHGDDTHDNVTNRFDIGLGDVLQDVGAWADTVIIKVDILLSLG